ncbi:MAG: hypothetical protein IKJ80_01420 [Clostridia bacterium]|nr:hypothetical protein [Clostridia bacterium]
MSKSEVIGNLIGVAIGSILSGVCVYFTKSIWSAVIPFACYLIGGWIGKSANNTTK